MQQPPMPPGTTYGYQAQPQPMSQQNGNLQQQQQQAYQQPPPNQAYPGMAPAQPQGPAQPIGGYAYGSNSQMSPRGPAPLAPAPAGYHQQPPAPIQQQYQQQPQQQYSQSGYYQQAPPALSPQAQPTMLAPPAPMAPMQQPLLGSYHHQQQPHQQMSNGIPYSPQQRPSFVPPGAPLPGSMDATSASTANRINPSMVPSPVAVNDADQARFNTTAFVTSAIGVQSPPLPSTMARYVDQGNSSSRFLRMTTYNVPCQEDVMHATRIPLAMVMQPFAERPSYEDPVPLVDFGPEGPVRCNRCRAYMNPFMTFGKGGRVFLCNICYMQNEVRDSYFCNLDATGTRSDFGNRSELQYGTIDVVAPADYFLKKQSKASILFAIESTRSAVQSGAFMAAVQTLKEFLSNPLTSQRYDRVGIVTFDKNVQFYDLRESLNEPQLMVMTDVLDPFVGLQDGLFFRPEGQSKELALGLLERLPALFQDTRTLEACLGSVTTASYEALKETGGRLVLMVSTLASAGLGVLKAKEMAGAIPSDKVHPALLPQGQFYRELGQRCAQASVSVNIIATPTASTVDIASINHLCRLTSGHCRVYEKFSFEAHLGRLTEETLKTLLRPTAYDCLAKVRCGSGLQVDVNWGHYFANEAGDLKFSCLDSEQSLATTFVYDSKLPENEKICFQLAILYTTAQGEPRIRLHNLALPCTTDISSVFKMADLDAIVALQAKQTASQLQDQPLPFLATQVSSRAAHILAAYRKHCAANMSSGQLVLPDALKLLPLYSSCILRQPAFHMNISSASVSMDYRVSVANSLVSAPIDTLPTLLYPRLWALHHLSAEQDSSDPSRYYPPCLRLSQDLIEQHGVYLLENGKRIIIWVGPQVDPALLENVFGVSQLAAISPNSRTLPDLSNDLSRRVRTLIAKLHHQRPHHHLSLSILRSGIDPWEPEWRLLLAEDSYPPGQIPSYIDYLCRAHGQIQQELATGPSLTERAALLNFLH